jgi:hypothetical protein
MDYNRALSRRRLVLMSGDGVISQCSGELAVETDLASWPVDGAYSKLARQSRLTTTS